MEIIFAECTMLAKRVWSVYWTLVKIMVPVLVLVKALDSVGATEWLATMLSPIMALVGLPDSTGIVWATAMLTNIYTAMAVFFSQSSGDVLSIAQITTLGTMILLAHSLPVEVAVAKVAGVAVWKTLLIRIGGAFVLGALLHLGYDFFGAFTEPSQILWQPDNISNDWLTRSIAQSKMLLMVLGIIAVLMLMLRVLQLLGIERLLHILLAPILMVLGVSKKSANIIVIGVTLGLSFGGGLLIEEARAGELSRRDIFLSLAFLGLCHSLIEDTLLILLLGADLSGILWARLLFALVVIAFMANVFFRPTSRD